MTQLLVFPGQGSQTLGMGRELADVYPAAKEVFSEVDEALGQHLTKIMWGDDLDALTDTANAQPAIMAVSIAAFRVLEQQSGKLIRALGGYAAGHSLGEYSALCAAGTLTLADTARLLRIRGNAMQAAAPKGFGAMAAVLGLDAAKVAATLAAIKNVAIANDNSPGQVVISGTAAAVEEAGVALKAAGAKRVIALPVSAPFHSPYMQPAADAMHTALEKVELKQPHIPVLCNVTAEPTISPAALLDNLVAQVCGTVRWRETLLNAATQHGVTAQLELGNGKVLAGLAKQTVPELRSNSIGTPKDVDAYLEHSAAVAA